MSPIRASLTDSIIFFHFFFESSKKSDPKMKHFSTFSQRPCPHAPAPPPQKMLQITLVSCAKVSSRLDQMAPHSCPFFVSKTNSFSTATPKHVWALWESPTRYKEIFFFSFSITFFRGFDHSSFSFYPAGHPNVIASGKGTNGWPPDIENEFPFL